VSRPDAISASSGLVNIRESAGAALAARRDASHNVAVQSAFLMMLNGLGPTPIGALGERLAVDKTAISRNIKVLERQGWVHTERGEDARERVVSVINAGAAVLAKARPSWAHSGHPHSG
jgi:DNA-binding MarR family transcriptional regulator